MLPVEQEIMHLNPGPLGRSPTQSWTAAGGGPQGGRAAEGVDDQEEEEFFSLDGSDGLGVLEDALDDVGQWAFDEEAGPGCLGGIRIERGGLQMTELWDITEDGTPPFEGCDDSAAADDAELIPGWRKRHEPLPMPPPFPQGSGEGVPSVDFAEVVFRLLTRDGPGQHSEHVLLLAIGDLPGRSQGQTASRDQSGGVHVSCHVKQWREPCDPNNILTSHPSAPAADHSTAPEADDRPRTSGPAGRRLRLHIDIACHTLPVYVSATQVRHINMLKPI